MSSLKVLSASFSYFTQRTPFKSYLKCFLFCLKYYLYSWDIWIFVIPFSTFYFEAGKYGLIMLWNSLHKLPTLIFGIQKTLSIKVPKMTCWWINKQIKFLNIFANLYITNSSSLVFHNIVSVGQSFCKNNWSSLFITTIYNYLTFLLQCQALF